MENAAYEAVNPLTGLREYIGLQNPRLQRITDLLRQVQKVRIRRTTSALPPSTDETPINEDATLHLDSNTGKVWFAYNKAGSIKKVELT